MTLHIDPLAIAQFLISVSVIATLIIVNILAGDLRNLHSVMGAAFDRARERDNEAERRDAAILNGDKAILEVVKANNAALRLLSEQSGAVDAGKVGRLRIAIREASEYATANGIDPRDVGLDEMQRAIPGDDEG